MSTRNDGIFTPLFQLGKYINLEAINAMQEVVKQRLYGYSTIIAIMLYRRLAGNISQADTIKALLTIMPEHFRNSKRGREDSISCSPTAFSKALKKMPLSVFHSVLDMVSAKMLEDVRPAWNNLHVFLLDGTTVKAGPIKEIRDDFPAASNQKGTSVFPVINLAIATELSTGLVIRPELGAMYGPNAISETQLGMKVIDRLPRNSLIIADSGFGIFRTAWHALTTNRYFLLRISTALFGSLSKRMEKQGVQFDGNRAKIVWPASRKNLKSSPWLPKNGCIEIYLHRIQVGASWIYLIENCGMPTKKASEFYLQRVNIETDIENVKVRLEGEELKGKSTEAAQKELSIIILHYQLIAATRMTAAKKHKVPARTLGFTGVRECFRNYFERAAGRSQKTARQHFLKALDLMANCKIPHRPGRSCKRECYHRRTRGDSFPRRRIKDSDNLAHGKAKTT